MREVVVRAADRAGGLHEQDRLGRDLRAGFGGVLGVVEADAHELADAADAGADAGRRLDQRQRRGVDRPSLSSEAAESASPAMSSTTPLRLRIRPAASIRPGCSLPSTVSQQLHRRRLPVLPV